MGLIYISILLVAIGFLIVTIYLCFVLKRVTNTMKSLSNSLNDVEKHVKEISPVLTKSLQETGTFLDDVTEKAQATEHVFDSVQQLGESIQSANTALQNSFGNLTEEEMSRKVKPFIEGIRWSEVLVRLYAKWKGQSSSSTDDSFYQNGNEIVATGREG